MGFSKIENNGTEPANYTLGSGGHKVLKLNGTVTVDGTAPTVNDVLAARTVVRIHNGASIELEN